MLKIHTHTHTDKQTDRHPTPGMTQARAKLRGPLCAAGGKRLCPDPVTGAQQCEGTLAPSEMRFNKQNCSAVLTTYSSHFPTSKPRPAEISSGNRRCNAVKNQFIDHFFQVICLHLSDHDFHHFLLDLLGLLVLRKRGLSYLIITFLIKTRIAPIKQITTIVLREHKLQSQSTIF